MRRAGAAPRAFLLILAAAAILAGWISPATYDRQFREEILAAPSRAHPLGTDDLGRDRLSRLLHACRVSLIVAPAAAILSTLLAALAGTIAGWAGGFWERAMQLTSNVFLSLPWMFLLLAVRAALPLDVDPAFSLAITICLLGALGWAGPARVVSAGASAIAKSDYMLMARAAGCRPFRIVAIHLLAALRPVLSAQFWISVPLFILAETNLSLLGLGVAEPMPSWGSMLREMENLHALENNLWILAPAILLVATLASLQSISARKGSAA